MRNRTRFALLGVLAVGVVALPGGAHAAKVTETAAGGPVPNATGGPGLATADGLFTQTFSLNGKKVKNKQVLDVNLTINSIGTLDANDDLFGVLFGPKGESGDVPFPTLGSSIVNLKFDDQSPSKAYCNPFSRVASYCNYAQGATGTGAGQTAAASFTGSMDPGVYGPFDATGFNPVFKGTNPKGTWTLMVWDGSPNPVGAPETATLGTSTLEVKTGKKFAKE